VTSNDVTGTHSLRILHCEIGAYPAEALNELRGIATVEAAVTPHDPGPQLRDGDYDAVFVGIGVPISRQVIESARSLRWIVTPTTGTSHIDVDAARQCAVRVISLAGHTELLRRVRATAEHTFALLLALRRRLVAAVSHVRSGGWTREGLLGEDLSGQVMGIVGYGRLGRMVADLALAFHMDVVVHDADGSVTRSLPARVHAAGLGTLLAEADVVSLHVPLNDSTRELLGPSEFALFKPGATLVNTSRGEVLSEPALLDALRAGRLAGAAVDVLAHDSSWPGSSPENHPMLRYASTNPNLLITPHIGGYSRQAVLSTRAFVVREFIESMQADATMTELSDARSGATTAHRRAMPESSR
jgi:D-3-phosphoglycerate dehydrogenase / 2-oxoglutarate reductase